MTTSAPTRLSPDQEVAIANLLQVCARRDCRPYVLCGPAGTGKTTIMAELARRLAPREVAFVAPTGKASLVLSSRLQREPGENLGSATTIHRALYGASDEVEGKGLIFGDPHAPCPEGAVLVVDEASMVGRALHQDLVAYMPPDSTLIYVGDREQLPPVDGVWGPNFNAPTALLTEIHRQALDSPILRIATDIRQGGRLPVASEPGYTRRTGSLDDVVRWMVERRDRDATVLCATNDTRKELNARIRAAIGHPADQVVAGDRMICLANHHDAGVMNGEIYTVKAVGRPIRIFEPTLQAQRIVSDEVPDHVLLTSLIGAEQNVWFKAQKPYRKTSTVLHADHGWALTVHKSQGSEWREVAIVLDDALMRWWSRDKMEAERDRAEGREPKNTIRRMLYTAVTRARDELFVFDLRGAS